MVRGYCPNQECPNIDVLDGAHPCPTCGREVRELSPREYWRTRTIKMMHAHEIAEIAEIQEVARRTLGEASLVPKAQKSEDTSPKEELESVNEVAITDSTEPLISPEEPSAIAVEPVSTAYETESTGEVEELMTSAATSAIREGELEEPANEEPHREIEAADLASQSESTPEEEDEPVESKEDLERTASDSAIAKPLVSEITEHGVNRIDVSRDEQNAVDIEEEGEIVLEEVSVVDDIRFAEGLVGAKVELEPQEEESIQTEPRGGEETITSGEVSEAQEITELGDRGEFPSETTDVELAEWKRSEALRKESAEEVSAPEELPVDGGMERPSSPVRIITFREGGTEIGICPYCGRFVRGSDLGRHKLKHRVRNVFGFQTED